MDENRFFRIVWRINSVFLLIAAILGIGVLLFAAYAIYKDIFAERRVHNVVNVDARSPAEERWQYGSMLNVPGTPHVMLRLESDQSYSQSYYSKSTSSARNYLFINGQSSAAHWLFDRQDYLITGFNFLSRNDYRKQETPPRAILYEVVKRDSDNDGRLSSNDLESIGLSMPDGTNYKEIVQEIDSLIGHVLVDDDLVLLVYERDGEGYRARVQLSDFTVLQEEMLPKVSSHTPNEE